MRFRLLLLMMIVPASALKAQQVQWASQLLDFSSEYKDEYIRENSTRWSASQVLGVPNSLKYGSSQLAWTPMKQDGSKESVTVGFATPQTVQQVIVGENFNAGAITEITLIDANNKKHVVYQNLQPAATYKMNDVLTYFKIKPVYNVQKLKLVINTNAIFGREEIDCIGISATQQPYVHNINVVRYTEAVGLPENLGPNVNSSFYDHLPIISPDGSKLYFCRKFAEGNLGREQKDDIYSSYIMPDQRFSKAENIGPPLNNEENNFICFVSSDNRRLYTANKYIKNTYNFNGLSVSQQQKNGEWSKPKALDIPNLFNDNEFAHYHMSLDEKVVLMAIQKKGGYGDLDLYVSLQYADQKWSEPKNLGSVINTVGSEGSVFLAADGKTLYFSSTGHAGYGSYDMFMSKRLDNTWTNWSKPLNLGDKINTDEMDIYYTIPASGDYAYFSSGRTMYGHNDLYRIRLPKEIRPEPVNIQQWNAEAPLKKSAPLTPDPADAKLAALKEQQKQPVSTAPVKPAPTVTPVSPAPPKPTPTVPTTSPQPTTVRPATTTTSASAPVSSPAVVSKREVVNSIQPYTPPPTGPKVLTPAELAAQQNIRNNPTQQPQQDPLTKLAQKDMPPPATRQPSPETTEPVPSYTPNITTTAVDPSALTQPEPTPVLKSSTSQPTDDYHQKLAALKQQQSTVKPSASNTPGTIYSTPPSSVPSQYPKPAPPVETSSPQPDQLQQKLDALKEQQRQVTQSTRIEPNPYQSKPYDYQPPKERQPEQHSQAYNDYQQKLEALKQQQKNVVQNAPPPVTTVTEPVKPTEPVKTPVVTPSPAVTSAPNPVLMKYEEKLKKLREEMAAMNEQPKTDTRLPETAVTANAPAVQPQITPTSDPKPTSVVSPVVSEEKPIVPAETIVTTPSSEPVQETSVLDQEKARLDSIEKSSKEAYQQLAQMLDKLGSNKQDLEKDITDLQQQRSQFSEEKDKLSAQNTALESEKSKLEAEKKQMDDLLARMQEERDKLAAEKQKLEQDRLKLDALKKQQEKEVFALKRSIDSLERVQQKTVSDQKLQQDYDLFTVPLEVGAVAQVNNIYFVADAAYLQIPSYQELDKVVAFLKKNAKLKVEIGGHTNGLCDDAFCQKLSDSRAKTCMDYLISKGIQTNRLTYKGYGKQKLLYPDKPGNPLNQRVEMKILSVD